MRTIWPAAFAMCVLLAGGGLLLNADAAHAATTLSVSPTGTDSSTCGAAGAPCQTITQAVTNASAGDTITVAAGTYAEQVTVSKQLILQGSSATIDATGQVNGVAIQPGADGSTVSGFTVQNALGEGILAQGVANVTISNNTVTGNDLGAHTNVTPFCMDNGPVPGDCGEGLHLLSTTNAVVRGNDVEHNAGGILITDEMGPASGNLVTNNVVANNQEDCGITLAAHSPNAWADGKALPATGGIFNNRVEGNTISNNGAGGVGVYASAPGTASYNNVVTGNTISGNGSAGVQLHAHAPNQSLDNNRITGNIIEQNNVVGDPDSGVMDPTGVLISSPVVPVIGTVISGNTISDNTFGIWLTASVETTGIAADNVFVNVTTSQQQVAAQQQGPTPPSAGYGTLAQSPAPAAPPAEVLVLLLTTIALAGAARVLTARRSA